MKNAHGSLSRRDWLAVSGLAASALSARAQAAPQATGRTPPSAPVTIAKVRSYEEDLVAQFKTMFDQIGGIGTLVRGKTVGMKLNLTGANRSVGLTAGDTPWVHPNVVGAVTAMLAKLGAKRIRILESTFRKHTARRSRILC